MTKKKGYLWRTDIHEPVSHGSNYSYTSVLLQRKSIVVVFKQHYRLSIQVSCYAQRFGCVNELTPLARRRARIWIFEKTHFKFGSQKS